MPGVVGCPSWCRGGHRDTVEHVSDEARLAGLILELLQYPGEDVVYLSVLDSSVGGRFFVVPMSVVPQLATAALRIVAPLRST
jgi:hypothetical protein